MAELVFSHLPKTGGTWVNSILTYSKWPPTYITHAIYKKTKTNTIMGIIRNPWAWYVSLYNYNKSRLYGTDGISSFNSNFWYVWPGCVRRLPKFEDFLRLYTSPNICERTSLNFDVIPNWGMAGTPLFETLYDEYIVQCDYVGKTESIRSDLKSILATLDGLTPELEERINTSNPKNTARTPVDYRTFYTDETAELVFNTHQRIISSHNYTF